MAVNLTAVVLPSAPIVVRLGQQQLAIVRVVVETVAGVSLILGRDGLATAWWRLRGRPDEQDG